MNLMNVPLTIYQMTEEEAIDFIFDNCPKISDKLATHFVQDSISRVRRGFRKGMTIDEMNPDAPSVKMYREIEAGKTVESLAADIKEMYA
jgi:hypothetical protein